MIFLIVVAALFIVYLGVVIDGYIISHRSLTRKPLVPTAKEEEDLLHTSPRQWVDDAENKVVNERERE